MWYQYEGLPAFFAPSGTSCIRATYGDNGNRNVLQKIDSKLYLHFWLAGDGTVSVRNVDVSPAGKYEQICGYADAPDAEEPGSLLVHFPNAPAGSYWILDTDYENYASVYSCQSILGLFQIEYGWLLLRDLNTSEDIIAKGREAFTKNGLDISKYELVNHENCQYDLPDVPPCN